MLISTSYLPPAWYFGKIQSELNLIVEAHEHFIKQTIRNRCHILAPNGVQQLIIPVTHDNRSQKPVKDILIANVQPWQRQHWRSLNAAYRRSAYFEFYMDDFAPFYHTTYKYLFDFNSELLKLVLDSLKIVMEIATTATYVANNKKVENDFRKLCDESNPVARKADTGYPQVFSYKHGFVPGLSIVDLLFNMGPGAVDCIGKL